MTASLQDGAARARIAQDLDHTFIVEAAAGTGKTTALISRMIALLSHGRARLSEIVAVTFTEKAAGEMKLRLRTELERAHANAETEIVRARFEAALAELEAARIGTIHSFCADLLRERPVEAGVDPSFEVLGEEQDRELVGRAFSSFFQRVLGNPPEGVRRILRRSSGKSPRELLLGACRDLVQHRDHDTPWRREPFDRDGRIDRILEQLLSLAALSQLASSPSDYLARALAGIARVVAEVEEREKVRPRDYDALEVELRELRKNGKNRREVWEYGERGGMWYAKGILRRDVLSRRAALGDELDLFLREADADLASCLRRDLWPVVTAYEELKVKAGVLDYLDLLIRTRDLVTRDAAVREELRSRIRCVFVDEFQDTDPLQAEIMWILASAGEVAGGPLAPDAPPPIAGKLFVVGDPKQSIYRFRRADVALYERIKAKLVAHGVELLTLSTSFRARPSIQRIINEGFAPMMQGAEDGSQAHYVALSPHRAENDAHPSAIALPVPQPYGYRDRIVKKNVASSSADAVGAFIDWLLNESGWSIPDPLTGQERAIESRDVCLLFRSTWKYGSNLVTPYVLALEARSVPHVLVGGRAFHDREEVLALAAVIRAIEHPDDPLSVYAALRGPFFALSDDQLLVHREKTGSLDPRRLTPDLLWDPEHRPVTEALDILRALHFERNRRPIADTIGRFLDQTRAHAGVASWPNGEMALANVLRVLELARRWQAQGVLSFRGFLERFEDQLERGEGVDAPVVEESAAGVRIMTVHKAKGLEFPVVVLSEPTLSRTSENPSRWVDAAGKLWAAPLAYCEPHELAEHAEEVMRADEAEEVRLAYVAATRAREILVVPCVGDGPQPGWVDPLHRALYPSEDRRRTSEPAPGCPDFGDDSVLDRPPDSPFTKTRSVKPGLHHILETSVVWWDPHVLGLGRVPRGGLRGTAIFEEGEAGNDRIEAHLAWEAKLRALRERGGTPSFRVSSVTAIANATKASAHVPRIEETAAPREGRPSGKRFGTLVHGILAECTLDASRSDVAAMARHQGALFAAPEDEIAAAIEAVVSALAHPLLRNASEADRRGQCRRECPILVPLDDGSSAEGVVDLAFVHEGVWTIVDYKTDRERGEKLTHAVQLELYARAIAAATNERVTTVLLYV